MADEKEEMRARAIAEARRVMREPAEREFSDDEVSAARERAAEFSRKAGEYMLSRVRHESRTRYR